MKKNIPTKYNQEKNSYLNKKRKSPDSSSEKENKVSHYKNIKNHHRNNSSFSTDSISHHSGKNSTLNKRNNFYSKNKIVNYNYPFIYILDEGIFFKKENKESIENHLPYYCFIEKNIKNEIYFYQYGRYNIDDIKDKIFCFRCNDLKCKAIICLNYKEKNDRDKLNIIFEHSIPYKKHSYIMYPTYGYQIYLDIMREKSSLKYIQLVNDEFKERKYYKNINKR